MQHFTRVAHQSSGHQTIVVATLTTSTFTSGTVQNSLKIIQQICVYLIAHGEGWVWKKSTGRSTILGNGKPRCFKKHQCERVRDGRRRRPRCSLFSIFSAAVAAAPEAARFLPPSLPPAARKGLCNSIRNVTGRGGEARTDGRTEEEAEAGREAKNSKVRMERPVIQRGG